MVCFGLRVKPAFMETILSPGAICCFSKRQRNLTGNKRGKKKRIRSRKVTVRDPRRNSFTVCSPQGAL